MANLARPVNMLPPTVERIIEFKGLNRRTAVADGEMSDMWNLTADKYPVLSPRKPRGEVDVPSDVLRPIRLIQRYEKLALIAIDENREVKFYYDGQKIDEVEGLSTSSWAIAINNKMCFFPEKTCIDITKDGVQPGTYRSLSSSLTLSAEITEVTVSNEDARISLPFGHGFNKDDAITINGEVSYIPEGGLSATATVNVSCVIEDVIGNTIVLPRETFIELTGEGATEIDLLEGAVFERPMPDLDYVIEWNNRLWGCSNADNTIYACKLGDPTNWQYFQGTSMDSYYAQQGTDEVFTGIAEYSGHIIFFKPNSMTRVYGTSPTNYQITTTNAYGVEKGSSLSVITINDTVFYKSAIGIMAYHGSIPVCISEEFNRKFKNVVAGTEGTKYYASCIIEEEGSSIGRLMVFDVAKGLWHIEDDLVFTSCCKAGNKVYYTTASATILTCNIDVYCDKDLMVRDEFFAGTAGVINPDEPTEAYEDIEWMAQFGPFDEYIEEHKIYSKLAMRLKANGPSSVKVSMSLNEGPWELVENYEHVNTKGDFIPIVPRRCDRYSVRVEGKGNCEIKSLTRRVRRGSFGRL